MTKTDIIVYGARKNITKHRRRAIDRFSSFSNGGLRLTLRTFGAVVQVRCTRFDDGIGVRCAVRSAPGLPRIAAAQICSVVVLATRVENVLLRAT